MLALSLSVVIGVGVLYIVDNRLANLEINVPACPKPVCPRPVCPGSISHNSTPIVTSNRREKNVINIPRFVDDRDVSVEGDVDGEGVNEMYRPHTQSNAKQEQKEHFRSSLDSTNLDDVHEPVHLTPSYVNPLVITQDSSDTLRKTVLLRQGYTGTPIDGTNRGDEIRYPSANDIVRYSGPGCYSGIDVKSIRRIETKDLEKSRCRPYTDKSIREGSQNIIPALTMTPGSNDPNTIVTRNIGIYTPKLYMGVDPYIGGVSYAQMSIETPADVDQIGSIPVNDYDGEPMPVNSFVNDS